MKKVMVWVPVILMAVIIFGFSKQDGTQSDGLSTRAAEVVLNIGDYLHIIHVDESNQQDMIERLQFPIRKCGHVTEYAVLGVLTYIALTVDQIDRKKKKFVTVFAVFLFACSDEFHQLFVPGRNGQFRDVLIDTAGCVIGILICILIERQILKNALKHEKFTVK